MADFLLELFSEEIPARMQADALEHLEKTLRDQLSKAGFSGLANKGFVTPRRLAVIIENLPTQQADVSTELKGPKIDAPEAALQGFLKKNNLTQKDLVQRDGVYFATLHQKGKSTAELLRVMIEEIMANFPWPKSMRWGANDVTWVRPLHSILALFDGKVVPVRFGTVKAGSTTFGHRFLAPKEIKISKASDYEATLEKAFIIADRDKRKAKILADAEKLAASKSLSLRKDEGLLEEVTGLVEWPVVLLGSIDEQFMDLPKEVLVSEMRAHQKYFALEKKDGGISDKFLLVANMETKDDGKAIVAGNKRVLRARLSDGRFFWDQDRKKKLDEWAQGLSQVTFHAKLGTIANKVERIKTLAVAFSGYAKADPKLVERAAELCKADLVTGMVGEFPDLQGVMGRYYALAQGEDPQVADAIRDHYLPLGPTSATPTQPVSVCVALADKLDTLIAMFSINEKPTGSKDPFALRRAALGVIRIILDNNLRIPLGTLPNREILDFLAERLKVQLKDSGVRHDLITAVFAQGEDDLVRLVARVRALQDFLATDDGSNLLTAYRRAANILAIEEKKDKATYAAADLKVTSLKEKEETDLAELLENKAAKIDVLRQSEQFVEAMKLLASLRASVDTFFDKIMVNADDKELRANRLRLLARIRADMDGIAQFASIE